VEDSERIYKELINEDASIWFTEDSGELLFLIKAPLNTIKSIIDGCKVQLLIGKDDTLENSVIHSGVKIFDDPINFLLITGTHRYYHENESLKKILENKSCRVGLYNEIGICVASSQLYINDNEIALKLIDETSNLYSGDFSSAIIKSLDAFDFTIDNSKQFDNQYKIDLITIDCYFSDWHLTDAHFFGLNEQEQTNIMDPEEGLTLEKQVWFSIENLFNYDIFKNPKYKSPKSEKELTDILAFHKLGIFLIETKSLSIFSVANEKTMGKKVSALKKHIKKAIKQLIGAKNNILRGTEIFNSKSETIVFDRTIIPHCIVVVSELLPFGDWSDIENQMLSVIDKEKIFLNIMDFREFMNIVKHCAGSKEYFDFYLMKRLEGFIKTRNIHLRSKIISIN
jgi:hypothetical protein